MKINLLVGALTILFFAGLCVSYFQVLRVEPLLIAVPDTSGVGVSVNSAEFINDRRVLIDVSGTDDSDVISAGESRVLTTYEIRTDGRVTALNTNHSMVIIHTNHTYPHVMGFELLSGRFFGRDAVSYVQRVAVLNRLAAFEIFGSFAVAGFTVYVNSAPHSVVGVIDDGADEAQIFLPAAQNQQADALAASLAFLQSEEYIRNHWQQIGVSEPRYSFVNFAILRQVVRDRLLTVLSVAGAFVLIFAIKKAARYAIKEWRELRRLQRERYALQLFFSLPMARLVGGYVVVVAFVALTAALALDAFGRVLVALDARGMLSQLRTDSFAAPLAEISRWYNFSALMFPATLIFLLIYVVGRGLSREREAAETFFT